MQRRAILSGLGLASVALSPFAAPLLLAREKRYKLSRDDIRPLAMGRGGCIASDRITVEGLPVRFMYRDKPRKADDPHPARLKARLRRTKSRCPYPEGGW